MGESHFQGGKMSPKIPVSDIHKCAKSTKNIY